VKQMPPRNDSVVDPAISMSWPAHEGVIDGHQ